MSGHPPAPRAAEERSKVVLLLLDRASHLERNYAPFAAAVWRECAAAILDAKPRAPLLPARVEHVATTIGHEADRLASVLSDDTRMVCSLRALRDELREIERMLKGKP